MAAIPAALAWIGAGLGLGMTGATEGLLDSIPKRKQQIQQQPQPVYHITTGGGTFGVGSFFTAAGITCGVVVCFGAYKYFWGVNPLDRVLPELEKSSRETLNQVRKADENQAQRAQQLDENNQRRLQQLHVDVMGEQRANFESLSEQVSALTEIALHTMTHITPGGPAAITEGTADPETVAIYNKKKEDLNQWARDAQKVVHEISDPQYHEQKRSEARSKIRAQIPNFQSLSEMGATPGISQDGVHDLRVEGMDGNRPARRRDAGRSTGGTISRMLGSLFASHI